MTGKDKEIVATSSSIDDMKRLVRKLDNLRKDEKKLKAEELGKQRSLESRDALHMPRI